jgi:hypothetical protein
MTTPNHTNDVVMSIINSSLSFSKLSFSKYLIQILQGNCTRKFIYGVFIYRSNIMIPYNVDIIPQVGFMTSCLDCISMLLFISHIVDG